jgi:large subunit ribosomal protein L31
MKDGIHPDYPTATIACACGNTFVTHSTRGDFQVDVCAACHPFYTGTQKLLDTAGRVDRFRKRYSPKAGGAKGAAAPPADVPATNRSAEAPVADAAGDSPAPDA